MNLHANTVDHWLHLHADGIQLDDEGIALIPGAGDEESVLAIEVPDNSDVCYFYAPVCPLSADAAETELYQAMELNRFGRPLGGCWLAWDPEFAMLTLCYNLHIPSSDSIAFRNTIDNFFSSLKEAKRRLSQGAFASLA